MKQSHIDFILLDLRNGRIICESYNSSEHKPFCVIGISLLWSVVELDTSLKCSGKYSFLYTHTEDYVMGLFVLVIP